MDPSAIRLLADGIKKEVQKIVVGHDATLDLLLTSLLADGHVLVEGVPGLAKTLLVQTFSGCLSLTVKRIQFTPDLMPGDILGTQLYNFQLEKFVLTKGPVFTQFLLADEINRAPPKTQSALLQAMQERTVSIDGKDHALDPFFMVIATQNPIEQEGTYPLPEAQQDRFLFKIKVSYPSRDEERQMVRLHGNRSLLSQDLPKPAPVASAALLKDIRDSVSRIRLTEPLVDYIVDLIRKTREHASLSAGASPRASRMLAGASRALAVLRGRDFVIPDDVKTLFLPALRHRVLLSPSAEIEGLTPDVVLQRSLEQVEAPR